ncbi:MAG: hypothetical protein IJV99_02590 [Clostridia bacterium]|nr:hypothetical protein [Clostridia bacterium]
MDSRITKKRLSDYLSYQWIFVIVMCVVAIIVWELAYTIGSVRLTVGQHFKFYYDKTVWSGSTSDVYNLFDEKDTFSYDILSVDNEAILSENDILSTRLYVQEGDILITNSYEPTDEEREDGEIVLAKSRIDNMNIYTLTDLSRDAKAYLFKFLKDDLQITANTNVATIELEQPPVNATQDEKLVFKAVKNNRIKDEKANAFESAVLDFKTGSKEIEEIYSSAIEQSKVSKHFRSRMKKDNRFRSDAEIASGIKKETQRIKDLIVEVVDFDKILACTSIHYNYTKYAQSVEVHAEDDYFEDFQSALDMEKACGRENAPYGIKVEALNNYRADGKDDTTKYFQLAEAAADEENPSSKDVVIMAFNFRAYQPDLQFECIAFMNTMVRACSNILD